MFRSNTPPIPPALFPSQLHVGCALCLPPLSLILTDSMSHYLYVEQFTGAWLESQSSFLKQMPHIPSIANRSSDPQKKVGVNKQLLHP